jgi:glycosyltransferase involved in cell wall biosynthesis
VSDLAVAARLIEPLADGRRVALVHDYLNQRGGAERVVLAMAAIWPEAPIYTSLYRPESTFTEFRRRHVRTSWLNRLPVDESFRALLPLYPSAMRDLGPIESDVVISSSSGWAHAVRTAPQSTHIVYCHSPARWLYRGDDYFRRRVAHQLALSPLRRWDRRAARRPDRYIANAHNVADRIRAAYGIDAAVVHPPVEIERFTPRPRGERLLVVSRLLAYKRIDLVVRAARELGLGLDIVGTGPELERLRALAGPDTEFHGEVEDEAVVELMEACSAFCFPGHEDFGIAPVEANAAGKPVVAFAAGGALESMRAGVTASFFAHQQVGEVVDAIRDVDRMDASPEEIAAHADRFSHQAFEHNLRRVVASTGR